MKFELLNTERLILKKISPLELNWLFDNCTEAEIKEQLGHKSEAEFLKEKARYEKGYSDFRRTILSFQISIQTSTEIIGNCGYHNWQAEHRRAEIGYEIRQDVNKQKGYMSEALREILKYSFDRMNLNRIEACVSPANKASVSLLQKFRFQYEGLMKQHYYTNGVFEDSACYALLRHQYPTATS